MNGSPKSAENVGWGSTTPSSVPATFEVKPAMKWYMAASRERREIGGRTPKASHVRNRTTLGTPPRPSSLTLLMYSTGYATRVFWVRETSV